MPRRRALNAAAREQAARAVARHIASTRWLGAGKRIGLYASMPQELGTGPLIELAQQRGCRIYLPRITSMPRAMRRFVPMSASTRQHDFRNARTRGR